MGDYICAGHVSPFIPVQHHNLSRSLGAPHDWLRALAIPTVYSQLTALFAGFMFASGYSNPFGMDDDMLQLPEIQQLRLGGGWSGNVARGRVQGHDTR